MLNMRPLRGFFTVMSAICLLVLSVQAFACDGMDPDPEMPCPNYCDTNPGDPSCPNYCATHPDDRSCPGFCESHPDDQTCPGFCASHPYDAICPYCSTNSSDPSCPNHCELSPDDPTCPNYCPNHPYDTNCPYCSNNPGDRSCPNYCDNHPEDSSCPNFCTNNPYDASCPYCGANPYDTNCPYCNNNPADSSCPNFCTNNPYDASCPYCVANPYDTNCSYCSNNPTDSSCPNFCSNNPYDSRCNHIVIPVAGIGGNVDPSTAQTVSYGTTAVFTIIPSNGYTIYGVTGCDGSLLGTTYTTASIFTDCTVDAAFSPITYVVTPSAGAGGNISPDTTQTATYNATEVFTVTPNTGYTASVSGTCGGSLSGKIYTTNAIIANCTVAATFTPINYIVTPVIVGKGGNVSPNAAQTVTIGATQAFVLIPNKGYIKSPKGIAGTCPLGHWSGNVWVTGNITANCSVNFGFFCQACLFGLGGWRAAIGH